MLGSNKQTYLVHRSEWKVWTVLAILAGSLRVVLYSSTDGGFEGFEGYQSLDQVREDVADGYCYADSMLLCNYRFQTGGCNDVYGYPLGQFLKVSPLEPGKRLKQELDCTLLGQFSSVAGVDVDDAASSMSTERNNRNIILQSSTVADREKRVLSNVMKDSLFELYSTYQSFGYFEAPETTIRAVSFWIREFFCVFGYTRVDEGHHHDPQSVMWDMRTEILSSDLSFWTADAFFEVFRRSLTKFEALLLESRHNLIQMDASTTGHRSTITFSIQRRDTHHDPAMKFLALLPQIYNELHDQMYASKNPGGFVCPYEKAWARNRPFQREKEAFHIFETPDIDGCMFRHYHGVQPILSDACMSALEASFLKMEELELEENAGFMIISHIIFLGVNLVSLLTLFLLVTSKKSFERRFDRMRKRLEQELNDPVLRRALELKAEQLPEEEERSTLIARLHSKIASWDSKTAAMMLMRGQVRIFRLTILFTMLVVTIFYLFLHIFNVSSLPRYLEIQTMSLAMLAASHWAPIGDNTNDTSSLQEHPVEFVMMGNSKQPLLELDPSDAGEYENDTEQGGPQ